MFFCAYIIGAIIVPFAESSVSIWKTYR
uniref:Uncharacterized protein n=1 Tax=Arundo donax TaxID=35708 RepID=A0A0A9B9H5_ARUDO